MSQRFAGLLRYSGSVALGATGLAALLPSFATADQIDEFVRKRMAKEHIPGLSLAVINHGKVVKLQGYGESNLELGVRAGPETVYQLGSMSKQFTAAAILILVQEHKLSLDDPVTKFVEGTKKAWSGITIRNLLTHTSGLPTDGILVGEKTFSADFSEDELIKSAMAEPLISMPGTKYSYGNLDYNLLAIIIEKVSGKSYGDFLRQSIFLPLGMTGTQINDRSLIVHNRAQAYLWDRGSLRKCEPDVSPSRYMGSASLLSTVIDLSKWDASLYTSKILSQASRRLMWTPTRLPDGTVTAYGFGWEISSIRGHLDLHHNGAMNGFVGNISRFQNDRLSVIVLVNESGLSNTERIATGVARFLLPGIRPVIKGTRPVRIKVDPALLMSFAGRYEYWANYMFTLSRSNGILMGQLPVGEADDYLPVSTSSIWEPEEGTLLSLVKNGSGIVTGLVVKPQVGPQRIIPRIGPLFSSLKPVPDPDPSRSHRFEAALRAVDFGGKAVQEQPDIAPGSKRDFAAGGTDFVDLRMLVYVYEQAALSSGIERHGEKVSRVAYYQMVTASGRRNLLIYLTSDGRLADYDIVDD